MKKLLLVLLVPFVACDDAVPPLVDADTSSDTTTVSETTVTDSASPSDTSAAEEVAPTILDCPSQAGPNPMPAGCDEVGSLCGVRNACGVCLYEPDCAYYDEGPRWQYADPLQNTDREECPEEPPELGSACDVDFLAMPFADPCDYCVDNEPSLRACIDEQWVSVRTDYCSEP